MGRANTADAEVLRDFLERYEWWGRENVWEKNEADYNGLKDSLLALVPQVLEAAREINPDLVPPEMPVTPDRLNTLLLFASRIAEAALDTYLVFQSVPGTGGDQPRVRLLVRDLHPWVRDAARDRCMSGLYRDAVQAAARSVNAQLKKKAQRQIGEVKLVREAFGLDAPRPGRPRLRVAPNDDSETYRNFQQGAMNLGLACFQGLRNPGVHEHAEDELPEHEAMEQLSAWSLFARWIDQAAVEMAP